MTIEGFITRIEEEFEDLPDGLLKPESNFKEVMEWSSISALIMITLILTEYEISINANDLNNSETIDDLFAIIKNRKVN